MAEKSINQYTEVTSSDNDDLALIQRGDLYKSIKLKWLKDGLVRVVLSLTDTQIKALNSSPITVIAAQGAGTYIRPVFGAGKLDYNSATYTANSLRLKYVGDAEADYIFTYRSSFLTSASSTTDTPSTSGVTKVQLQENTGIEIFVNTADPTVGNSTVVVELFFEIFRFA